MQRIFRTIKKKKNLRKMSAVWLFLVLVEILCPVFGNQNVSAAPLNLKQEINYSQSDRNDSRGTSISASSMREDKGAPIICNDECLCHVTALIAFTDFDVKKVSFNTERLPFLVSSFAYSTLPPPYLPPKNS